MKLLRRRCCSAIRGQFTPPGDGLSRVESSAAVIRYRGLELESRKHLC